MSRIVPGRKIAPYSVKQQQAYTKMDFLRMRLVFKTLILVSLMVFLSLFYIWSRIQIVDSGYKINELKRRQAFLKNENKLLQMELSLLKSPTRLEKFAAESLKMRLPTKEQIIEVP